MEWTLGITNAFSFFTTMFSMIMITLFVSMFCPFFFAVPDTKKKTVQYFTTCILGSFLIAYCTFAYLVSLEINEINYKNLQEKIEPYMADQKIKELLSKAKENGEISSAERDRLYHRVNQIEDLQFQKQATKDGEFAKKLLIGE